MSIKKRYLAVFLLVFCPFLTKGQTALANFLNTDALRNAKVSILVSKVKTGNTICAYHEKNAVTPASTMKLVTTAAALETLGANFCFQTEIYAKGELQDSILNGNLVVRGAGDPTLGSKYLGDSLFLDKWVEAVKNAGIQQIKGKIIIDESIFDNNGVNATWLEEDLGNYYASGAYGISYLDNTYVLLLTSGKAETGVKVVGTQPEIPDLQFDNHVKASRSGGDNAYIHGAPRSNKRSVTGTIPANRKNFAVKGDIPQPATVLAKYFLEKLTKAGIVVENQNFNMKQTATFPIYTHYSSALQDIITDINHRSNNHYAEHLFRRLAVAENLPATWGNATEAVHYFWESKNLFVEQLTQYDGSGLSPKNAVSAAFFVDLLNFMQSDSENFQTFYNSLPTAGVSGTLKNFLKNSTLESNLHAKSGTLSNVKSYAGYFTANKGDLYSFAVLVNFKNSTSKKVTEKIEKFLLEIYEEINRQQLDNE